MYFLQIVYLFPASIFGIFAQCQWSSMSLLARAAPISFGGIGRQGRSSSVAAILSDRQTRFPLPTSVARRVASSEQFWLQMVFHSSIFCTFADVLTDKHIDYLFTNMSRINYFTGLRIYGKFLVCSINNQLHKVITHSRI